MAEAAAVDVQLAHMTLADWLDDLTVRFLLNLPPAELSSVPRLCFQVEEAQWFYEDFIRPGNPSLPSLNLRQFLLTLFSHCPLLSGFDATQHVAAYEEFLSYKVRVPVRGAILMDDSMEKVLLVRGWKKGASWSFPRGKINKDEKDLDCAIREVYEETGYDIAAEGLVQPNEQQDGQVKAIDITMREQHMKLFVFRGVPLDTHFEPKTRKEISKIQWYNVKDLPGFKKQKGITGVAGQGQGEAATSKFYMVAPFLGHLKKWIGQQRRGDFAAAQLRHSRNLSESNTPQAGITEDEREMEQDAQADNVLSAGDQSADELKRLLSIGVPTVPPSASKHLQPQAAGHTDNLLAMLKGGQPSSWANGLPHTPLEQIDPALPTQQPNTPQPYHPRQPSIAQSSQHFQQSEGNFSSPNSRAFGLQPGYFGQSQQPQFGHLHPHMRQHSQHQSLPVYPPVQGAEHQYSYQANAAASSLHLYRQMQASSPSSSQGPTNYAHLNRYSSTAPANALASPLPIDDPVLPPNPTVWETSRKAQQPLGSEQSAPEASKLPAPNLNAHSLKLLDAFKNTSSRKPLAPELATNTAGLRTGGQQQAALLDLFRKPSDSQASTVSASTKASAEPEPASPALTDVTVKALPSPSVNRTSTLNEITRTLPAITKAKSPVSPIASTPPSQAQLLSLTVTSNLPSPAAEESHPRVDAQRTKQSSTPQVDVTARPKSRGQLYDPSKPSTSVRASSQSAKAEANLSRPAAPTSHRMPSRQAPRSPNVTLQAKSKQPISESVTAVPQFSILQRPDSSAGRTSSSPVPHSPLRNQTPRQGFQPQVLKRPASSGNDRLGSDEQEESGLMPVDTGDAKKDHLLSLFGKSSTAKTPEPPPSPRLLPERKSSSHGKQPETSSQQVLLSLFNKQSSNTVMSPGTPISPFTLNSPGIGGPPPNKIITQPSETRSGLGSMSSVVSNGNGSGQQTPTSATPTMEAKGFMLDYLNGVVKKEAYRGAKRQ